ncbi:MAG: hypothetical protein H6935_05510 [Thiobacillus sp.]|nr:hypothetical protein [Thiobacillus sp.]
MACVGLLGCVQIHAQEPIRAAWFPDASNVTRFTWRTEGCEDCVDLHPRPDWQRMADLAGIGKVRFQVSSKGGYGPAWSSAPDVVVLSPEALGLPRCQLAFLVGHELVHIAQRHFDEDAHALLVLSGMPPNWTKTGQRAMELLEGDFPLALRMSPLWHQQEMEADWVGALLAAQASGCSLEQGALPFLGADSGSGGGVVSAHDPGQERVRFLGAFAESARRLMGSRH